MARAFLLGAGSTRAFYNEAPLIGNFFDIYKDNVPEKYETIKSLLEDRGIAIDNFNIETLMVEIDKFNDTQKHIIMNRLHHVIFLALYTKTRPIKLTMASDEFTEWGHFISSSFIDKNDFFMTLNYDITIEREIYGIYNEIDLGFDPSDVKNMEDLIFGIGKGISVYHLHGAMNWHYDNKGQGQIYRSLKPPKLVPTGSSSVIVPFGKKRYNDKVINSIWSQAKSRLLHKHTNELIVIGCSLDDTDEMVISLINSYIKKRGKDRVKIIYLQDKNNGNEEVDHYEKLFGLAKFFKYGLKTTIKGRTQGAFDFILNG